MEIACKMNDERLGLLFLVKRMSSEVATLELEILKQVFGNVVGKTLVAFVSTSKALAHPCTLEAIISTK